MRTTATICALLCFMVASAHCQSKPPAYYCVNHILNLSRAAKDLFVNRTADLVKNYLKIKLIVSEARAAFSTCKLVFPHSAGSSAALGELGGSKYGVVLSEPDLKKLGSTACLSKMQDSYEKIITIKGLVMQIDLEAIETFAQTLIKLVKCLKSLGVDDSGLRSACL